MDFNALKPNQRVFLCLKGEKIMSLNYQKRYYAQLLSNFKLAKSVEEKDELRRKMSSTEEYIRMKYGAEEVNKLREELGLETYGE